MAKIRSKKKRNGVESMEITESNASELPQAMDTSESVPSVPAGGASNSTKKKGVQMKRTKNLRKKKAIAKAIAKNEMIQEKTLNKEFKKSRTQSAKSLYE